MLTELSEAQKAALPVVDLQQLARRLWALHAPGPISMSPRVHTRVWTALIHDTEMAHGDVRYALLEEVHRALATVARDDH
jgi:hypothetical protein